MTKALAPGSAHRNAKLVRGKSAGFFHPTWRPVRAMWNWLVLTSGDHGGHWQLELALCAVREIHAQPTRYAEWQRRDGDFVELILFQRAADRDHRIGIADLTCASTPSARSWLSA
jgi:hypothetical protein